MRRYETTFIVNPQSDDAAIDRQVSAVADLIKNDGGQILHENRIGTRRLAYPIAGLVQGYYSSLVFEAETTVLPKLERHFKLEEPYIRYLTILYEGKIPVAGEATDEGAEAKVTETPAGAAKVVAVEAKPAAEAKAVAVEAKPAPETKTEAAPAEVPATTTPVSKPADDAEEEL